IAFYAVMAFLSIAPVAIGRGAHPDVMAVEGRDAAEVLPFHAIALALLAHEVLSGRGPAAARPALSALPPPAAALAPLSVPASPRSATGKDGSEASPPVHANTARPWRA